MLDEIWDWITEGISSAWEAITGIFENISEFSVYGLIFGVVTFGFVFVLRKQMLYPFLLHMGKVEFYFWMIITYLGCFIVGYLIGKHFENT